jgi:hypothetical protein
VTIADLDAFCFGQPALFVIPLESLNERGMTPAFATRLQARRDVGARWCERFDEAFALAWRRRTELATWAPDQWLPARRQNVCVVTQPERTRPLFLPLDGCSWVLDAHDVEADDGGVEFAAFCSVLAERLALTRDLQRAFVETVGYWLPRTDEEIESFVRGARACRRPDAAAFVALADALPTLRQLHHETLRPPPGVTDQPLARLKLAGVLAPPSLAAPLREFTRAVREAGEATAATFAARARADATDDGATTLSTWLERDAPAVVVVAADGSTLWDPATPEATQALASALGPLSPRAAASLRLDLQTIDEHTRRFLTSLRAPDALPGHSDQVDQADGVYLHTERRLIAYALQQPGLDARREEAPPFHRWLLEARVMHEWGHLLEEAGIAGVRPGQAAAHAEGLQTIADDFESLVAAAPAAVREAVGAQAVARAWTGRPGDLVARMIVDRMSDYLANLVARRYVSTAAMESYLRTNVPAHVPQGLDPLSLVARHAYEFQYLTLAQIDDPWRYFCDSTWIDPLYLQTGLLDGARLRRLFDSVTALCGTYGLDPGAFVEAPRSR